MIAIAPLREGDRAEWEALARGYKAFYNDPLPDEDYDAHLAAAARRRARSTASPPASTGAWSASPTTCSTRTAGAAQSCYLQDLFTAEAARGRGVATALVDAVADAARAHGATAYYWLTKEDNRAARALYDRIARLKGFLRYDYPLL